MDEEQVIQDGRIVIKVERQELELDAITHAEIDAVMKS